MLLEKVCSNTNEYIMKMPKDSHKDKGQCFTSREIVEFMANIIYLDENRNWIHLCHCISPTLLHIRNIRQI